MHLQFLSLLALGLTLVPAVPSTKMPITASFPGEAIPAFAQRVPRATEYRLRGAASAPVPERIVKFWGETLGGTQGLPAGDGFHAVFVRRDRAFFFGPFDGRAGLEAALTDLRRLAGELRTENGARYGDTRILTVQKSGERWSLPELDPATMVDRFDAEAALGLDLIDLAGELSPPEEDPALGE